ncbi:MAG: efflux RND transporter permease subunit [Myxococcota bacterium]
MNLPEFSLKKPTVILLIFLGLSAWGFYSFTTISRREDPKIEISYAAIFTVYPGASAKEVEKKVTKPIEEVLETVASIEELQSESKNNVSIIMLKVDYNSDFSQQWDLIRARINSIKNELPSSIQGPTVIDDFGDVISMIVSIHGDAVEPDVLKEVSEDLKSQILRLESVGKVELEGEYKKEINIAGELNDFLYYDFGPISAQKLLSAQNMGVPGGILHGKQKNYRILPPVEYNYLNELKKQIFSVSDKTGEPLRLEDVFEIKEEYSEPQEVYIRTEGRRSMILNISMKSGYDVTDMGVKVREALADFRHRLPEGVEMTLVHDQPAHVDKNLGNFLSNLYQSVLFVALAMVLLLGIGSSLLVALGLPLAILVSLSLMPIFGVDLERASVAAFIIALGMLVDNSIIVIDHIHLLIEKGTSLKTACIRGAQDLIYPILGGTIASILAFFPMLLLPDEMGAYLRSLPWVLTFSLGASFFIAVCFTPILAYYFLRFSRKGKKALKKERDLEIAINKAVLSEENGEEPDRKEQEEHLENLAREEEHVGEIETKSFVGRFYKKLMSGSLKMWPLVIILAAASFGGSLYLFRHLGLSFFPMAERDQFVVDIWTPEGSSISNTRKISEKVEKIIRSKKGVKSTLTVVGKGLPRFMITHMPQLNSFNFAQILVNTDSSDITPELVKKLEKELKHIPGARIVVKQMLLGIAIKSPVALKVSGDSISELRKISSKIQNILEQDSGIKSVRDNFGSESLAYRVMIDEEKALKMGITRLDTALALLTAVNGFPVTIWRAQDDPMSVNLKLKDGIIEHPEDLLKMAVKSQAIESTVLLSTFAELQPSWEIGKIHRNRNQRAIIVRGYTKDGVLANDVLKRTLPKIRKLNLPAGYNLEVEGEEKERKKTFKDLTIVFAVTIFALFFVLAMQFGTLRQALVILGAVPLALVGGVLGLYFTGNSFGFTAFIGIIALAGIVIKNAVVWVEFVETSVKHGMEYKKAVVNAGLARLRPILLTAATTIGGLVPLALWGGVMWAPMAWTMIFGLGLSTLLTLIVVPVLYYLIIKHPESEVVK